MKRFLEKFAYKIRSRAREIHETNFSTSIRMDDVERSLFLATRERGSNKWRNYTRDELEAMDEDDFDMLGIGSESEEEEAEMTLTPTKSTPKARERRR